MSDIFIGCTFAGGFLTVLLASQHYFRVWVNPISVLLSSWVPMFCIQMLGWIPLISLEPWFIFAIASSLCSFSVGCLLFSVSDLTRTYELPLVQPERYRLLLIVTAFIGLSGFIGYAGTVIGQFGWEVFFFRPGVLRQAMSLGRFSDPFKFFNYMNLFLPVLVIIGIETGVVSKNWLLPGFLSLISNVFSTGRTRIIWAILWLFFTFLLSRQRRWQLRPLAIILLFFVVGTCFVAFKGIAKWRGQRIDSLEITQNSPDLPPSMRRFSHSMQYFGSNLSYLQQAMSEIRQYPIPLPNLLLPYYKTLTFLMPQLRVPKEILPFRRIPFRTNVGSWLVQFFLDLGWLGLILPPFLIGALTSWLTIDSAWPEKHPIRLFFGGLLLFLIWISFVGNKLISTPTWLAVLVGYPSLLWACKPAIPVSVASQRET